MSINPNRLRDPDEVLDNFAGWDQQVSPKLTQTVRNDDGEVIEQREVEPIATTRLGGTLPWETESFQLQCGETVTSNNGDMNIRLAMEAVLTHTQFKKLSRMRANPADVILVSRAYDGPVTFDEMKFERVPDDNGGITAGDENGDEPRYTVQLQSKETDDTQGLFEDESYTTVGSDDTGN